MNVETARTLIERDVFDPVVCSDEENAFILEYAGLPPHVALSPENIPTRKRLDDQGIREVEIPAINVETVRAVLTRLVELEQIAEHRGRPWAGVDVVKDRINLWLNGYRARMKEIREIDPSEPHPSMAHFTSRGEPIFGAAGADRGRVRTFFDEKGNRIPWAINLRSPGQKIGKRINWAIMPEFGGPDTADPDAEVGQAGYDRTGAAQMKAEHDYSPRIDEEEGTMRCPVPGCHHIEQWDVKNPSTRGLAKGRLKRHFATARDERTAHNLARHEMSVA